RAPPALPRRQRRHLGTTRELRRFRAGWLLRRLSEQPTPRLLQGRAQPLDARSSPLASDERLPSPRHSRRELTSVPTSRRPRPQHSGGFASPHSHFHPPPPPSSPASPYPARQCSH